MFAANTLVVGVFFLRMVSHVTYALELGNPLQQRTLDTFTQGHVSLPTALAAATELEHGDTVIHHVDQADLAAMAGQARIDLGLQVVVDTLVDRAIGIDVRHLGIGRLMVSWPPMRSVA